MRGVLDAASPGSLAIAAAVLALLLGALIAAVSRLEFGKAARRRRRLRQALARAQRARAQAASETARTRALSPADLARLEAFRERARLLEGEPEPAPSTSGPFGWWSKLRIMWRTGYSGWIIAAVAGAFSMATHFGAFWLIAGGGWPGAVAITLASTVVMVAACFWVMLGLVGPR